MSKKINETITWVGQTDWELTSFHGDEYSINRGTSYNAYLVRAEKTVLIDTVWDPFAEEFVEKLAGEIDLNRIDFIVANHAERDHSGALPVLMRAIPDKPVYCTANGVKSLKGHYHQDWNFKPVKTGDRLSLGNKELIFVEAPMLHWPDSMFCYLTGDSVLFSNDAFGQHYATELLYNDLVDQAELYQEAVKYYANILTPFSQLVTKKINEFAGLNLPLSMICPSHGVIWRKEPFQIVEKYLKWADNYQENQVTIVYDTMWEATRRMAEAMADGIRSVDGEAAVKLFNAAKQDKNDIITEVFKAKAVLVGSPTINKGILHSIAGLLDSLKGLGFKNKKAAAFGSYGWSGEGVKIISERLKDGGFELINDGLRTTWNPDADQLNQCFNYGAEIGKSIK